MSDTASPKKKVTRSPSYPGLDLDAALVKVKVLYDKERQHATSIVTAFGHLDYTYGSGAGNVAVAAMKKFGLIEDRGNGENRQIWVTDLAVDILENPDAQRRSKAKKEAAFTPPIHAALFDQYGMQLPSDANLKWELVRNRSFSETGAAEFIANYRATLSQVGLGKDDTTRATKSDEDDGVPDETGQHDGEPAPENEADSNSTRRRPRRERAAGVVEIAVPVPGFAADQRAVLELPGKLTEAQWTFVVNLITAMKDGVLRTDDDSAE